jgi:cytidine deaminase
LLSDSEHEEPGWPEAERRARTRRGDHDRRRQAAAHRADDRRRAERRSLPDRRDEAGWIPVSLDTILVEDDEAPDPLIAAASDARVHAHARYSGFAVGAALETVDGRTVTGCNVENATYGLTLCAERVALVKALSDGHEAFTRIAIVADTHTLTPPCGACRQLLWEYCGDIEVVLANFDGARARLPLSSLLPLPFDGGLLE